MDHTSALLASLDSIGLDLASVLGVDKTDMDVEEISPPDSPLDAGEPASDASSSMDKQLATLQTYLKQLPYQCESQEDMQKQLEYIVGMIAICARAKSWLLLTTWDGALQCWLLMRYPIPKSTRARLARLYYELCLVPGLEPRVIRSWADMLSRLLSSKPDQRRKLEPSDLQLPWKPLWRALQKELWPKRRLHDSTRNVINVLLFVAQVARRYFPATDTQEMMAAFLPVATKESILTMIPVMTSFLPLKNTHVYIPTLFKLWEALNSSIINDWLLELCGDLSEEHVASKAGDAGEGGAEFKDVGIWTEEQWTLLMNKTLGSMNVPVGQVRGASTTAGHADQMADKQSLRIKHTFNKCGALSKIIVYSMALDGPIRDSDSTSSQQIGYLAGSRSLDSLDKLITSTESYFHPSNAGHWSLLLTHFIYRLATEFCKRWMEEQQPQCKTPVARRLTPAIRRAFVVTLRTPALLSMFCKDPVSPTLAQGALRTLAMLEPGLILPELLERAYSGLEVVNETHRTTAVLSALSGVALPLVSERRWLGGQKHILPLLELCIPGIDLNDPMKTLCASMFIVSVVQHMKIGDLSIQQGGVPLSSTSAEAMMDVDGSNDAALPTGTGETPILSREEERALARDSTANFADWLVSLFRRIFALYENLPEEGGKKNTTGGKMEEAVLKSIKGTLDILCLQLSEPLFDLILNLVYDYATSNVKANAVRAFGQLIGCLARVNPAKTIAKFLPYCSNQIIEELKHGASSMRTTSSGTALPSDTTLHWNMGILRGCLGYGGVILLQYKDKILELLQFMIEKTRSERGYAGTGRLLHRIMHTLVGVYPINSRFINSDEWDDPEFDSSHNLHWGRLYTPEDVIIEWHTPSAEEIDFVIEILDKIACSSLDKIEHLLESAGRWDSTARNDFCRYLHQVRSVWSGLSTLFSEGSKEVAHPQMYEDLELDELVVRPVKVKAGFALEDPADPRYQKVVAHRTRFGHAIHRAAEALRQKQEGEDHIDAVISVSKAIDVYLLEYAMTRTAFDALQKTYTVTRDLNRMWPRQKENSRQVFLKRAQAYHSGRVYLHSLYRRRSALDDQLLEDLTDLSLSPYTRVRRHAQAVLQNACGYYVRSTRFCLPLLFKALAKGTDPDRMKGALYVLWNKGIASYALSDPYYHQQYLYSVLECQHQEKPSVQKLVGSVAHDAVSFLTDEAVHTISYTEDSPGVNEALDALASEFSPLMVDPQLLKRAIEKAKNMGKTKRTNHQECVTRILEFATRPSTHWRYVQSACQFLMNLVVRDIVPPPELAEFFVNHAISPHTSIRSASHKALVKMTAHIKIRTFVRQGEEIWLDEWRNPLQVNLPVDNPENFLQYLWEPCDSSQEIFFIDKLETGFLVWGPTVKAYKRVGAGPSAFSWESHSQPALAAMRNVFARDDFFEQLAMLLSQESSKNPTTLKLRPENVTFVKSIAKMFENEYLDVLLAVIEPLLTDTDRYKQRAGAEIYAGILRGSKHWPQQHVETLQSWSIRQLPVIFSQMKPDTVAFWEEVFNELFSQRDPRRAEPIAKWILSLPLEFHGDSAFDMTKTLSLFVHVIDFCSPYFGPHADKYMNLFISNANTGYAEIRNHIAQILATIIDEQWRPSYTSLEALLQACAETKDPLGVRSAKYYDSVTQIASQLPVWKQERFPPPRTSQSQYDKIGLTMLQWIWSASHGPYATLVLPYVSILLPEILRMSELNDSSELQKYSSAVLYVLSAVDSPAGYVEVVTSNFLDAIQSSDSWRVRLKALPTLLVFFYRNLMNIPSSVVSRMMDVLLECLSDENVEVREMASKMLSGIVRCSQRQSIISLRDRFIRLARQTKLPQRRDPNYAQALRTLHSAILGLCALIDSVPYSVEPWMPHLTDVLAEHATDPAPISTTIRKCASDFKKTHQDTWHKDQLTFDEDQLQNLSAMLVGTSYYA